MSKHEIGCLNHCTPGGHGGGGSWKLLGIVIVAVVVTGLGYKVRHGIETGIDIGLWVTGSVVGLIIVALVTLGVVKITRRVRVARAARPAELPAIEPVYKITQMSTHRTVRGAIEAPRTSPEAIPGHWYVKDTEAPARRKAATTPHQETDDDGDYSRSRSRFR